MKNSPYFISRSYFIDYDCGYDCVVDDLVDLLLQLLVHYLELTKIAIYQRDGFFFVLRTFTCTMGITRLLE